MRDDVSQAVASWLLAQGGASAAARDPAGATPAHWAAAAGHVPALSALLARRADADTRDHGGTTPAHWLAGEGHVHALRRLAAARADLAAADAEGLTPAHAAARFGDQGEPLV